MGVALALGHVLQIKVEGVCEMFQQVQKQGAEEHAGELLLRALLYKVDKKINVLVKSSDSTIVNILC